MRRAVGVNTSLGETPNQLSRSAATGSRYSGDPRSHQPFHIHPPNCVIGRRWRWYLAQAFS
jgi:hypothetical protein